VYSPNEKEGFEQLLGDNFGLDSVNYGRESVINGHDAHIFDVTLGGGTAEGPGRAWHCGEKNRVYVAAVVYPSEIFDKGEALDAISKIRCFSS
jgi:hypothetical protein